MNEGVKRWSNPKMNDFVWQMLNNFIMQNDIRTINQSKNDMNRQNKRKYFNIMENVPESKTKTIQDLKGTIEIRIVSDY